jgi:hypothetical protein
MTETDKELAGRLRELMAKATPGPWYQAGQPWFRTGSGVLAGSPDPHVGFLIIDTESWDGERGEYLDNGGALPLADPDDDAAYIAAVDPQTVAGLLDAIDRLTTESDALRARVETLEGALKPFADEAARVPVRFSGAYPWTVHVGDLRAARAALSKEKNDGE